MGVLFDNVTMEQALDRAETLMEAKASAYCVTPNGEIVWEAMQDPAFRSILNEADLVLPDGAGVVLGSRILERPLQEKVAGIAFAEALVQRMAARGGRLYLPGASSGSRRDPPISSSYRCLLSARWPLLSWQWRYPAWWYGCTKPAARGKPSPGPSWPLPRH